MQRLLVSLLALALVGCSSPEGRAATGDAKAQSLEAPQVIAIQGVSSPRNCVSRNETQLPYMSGELRGGYRRAMLTPEADKAGVRVFTSGTSVNEYGSVTLLYTNREESCILWSESLTLQEYSVRFGMSPLGLSPFYEPETATAGDDN